MFYPYYPNDQELKMLPEVDVRTDDSGGIVIKLSYYKSQVIEIFFREIIAFYCVEESNYELSPIPGLPVDAEFSPHAQKSKKTTPIWKSSIDYRRSLYSYLDSYRGGSLLETYIIWGADYIVVVESIGSVDIHVPV